LLSSELYVLPTSILIYYLLMQYFIISFSYCLLFIYNFVVVVIVLNKIQLALLAKPLVA